MTARSAVIASVPFRIKYGSTRVLVQCIVANIRVLLTIFREGARNGFF
jgi:hypothetical protein